MKAFRRILRITLYAAAVVAAAAIGALVVLTATERGRQNLAGIISNLASSKDRKVTVAGLDGIWSGALRVGHVVVEDGNGPWLVARDVAVDWSPLALLSQTFRAERIAAGRIEVARLPVASQEAKSESGPGLPVSLDIERIDLPDIALGKELAGAGIAELSARGSLKADAEPLSIASDLAIARRDGGQGAVEAKVAFAPADNRLDLDVHATEPAGGIIANLLKLSGAPPVEIVIKGSGPLADWQGAGTFSVDGHVVTRVEGRHQLTDRSNRIEATGQGEFQRFLPDMLKPLLAGTAHFDIAGTTADAGSLFIERATLASDTIEASAKGAIDPQSATDFAFELAARDAPVVLSLATGGAPVTVAVRSATVRAFGDGKEPVVDVAGDFVSVVTGGTEVRDLTAQIHSDGFDVLARSGPVQIGLAAESLITDVATLARLAAGRVTANLSGTVSRDRVVLDEGLLRSDALNASLTAQVTLADLAMKLAMNADAASTALPAQLQPVLGERVTFSATATRDPQGAFAANSIELSSGALKASGTASATGSDIKADLKGSLGDISPLSPLAGTQLAGGVDFSLQASGARSAPDFTVTASSDSLTAAGRTVKDVALSATGKADIAEPVADIALAGTVGKDPLSLKASLATAGGQRSIKDLSLSLGASRLGGDLALNESFLPIGTLVLDIPDLAPLAALAGQAASGDVKGTVAFAAEGDVPSISIDLASQSIRKGDLAAAGIAAKVSVANALKAPALTGSVSADSVTSGETVVSGIGLDLEQDGDWTGFTGKAAVQDVPATVAGRARLAGGVATVELSSGTATVKGIEVAILGPSLITVSDGRTRIEQLLLDVGGGSVTLSGTAGDALDLKAEIADVPASLANGFIEGLGAEGQLNGSVTASGTAAEPLVSFDARLSGLQTAQSRQAGVGALEVNASGSYVASTGVRINKATISGDGIAGTAEGILNPNGASDLSLDLAADAAAYPIRLGNAQSPIDLAVQALSLKAVGPKNEVKLDASVRLASLATRDARVDGIVASLHSDTFDLDAKSGPFSVSATADRIDLDSAAAPLLAGPVRADATGSFSTDTLVIDRGTVRGPAINGIVGGRVFLADGSISLNVAADALSSALPAAARGLLGERTRLSAGLKRDALGNIAVESLELASGTLKAAGQAALTDGKVSASLKGGLDDASSISKDARGDISFSLGAEGEMSAPDLSLTLGSDRLTVAGRDIAGLRLTASGKADPENPAADVALSGSVAGQPLQGRAVLRTSGGRREINDLNLSLGANRVSGSLLLDEAFLPEGDLLLDLPDIGPLAALALEKAEGDVKGTIRFSKDGGTAQLAVNARTARLLRGDLSARGVAIDALVGDYTGTPTVSGTVRADGVTSGATSITGIAVDLKRDGEWTGFSGGATVKDIPARATGRVRVADGVTTVELSSGEAIFRGIKAAVARPSTVVVRDGVTTLQGFAIGIGRGTATVNGIAGQTLDLDVGLVGVPVAVANNFAPGLDAAGTVSGTVKVTGAAANPSIAYDINGAGIQTSQTRGAGVGGLSISSAGTYAGGRLNFQATAGEASGINLRGGGTVTTSGAPALDLNFTGGVPFAFLAGKLAAQGLSLTGTANVALAVKGPATAPQINGTVSTSGARLIDARSGLAINDIAADVTLGGGVARINRLTGRLSTRGTITVGGTVGIDPAQGFPADLDVRLADGRYTDGRLVTANLSGDLKVTGPLASAPGISGTVNLGRTVITVPDRLPSSLSALNVKRKGAPADVRAQDQALRPAGAAGGGGGGGIALDVTVNAPNQIFIQGRGLDAELGGTIRLTGQASAPTAVGQFTLRRGRLAILGKRLNFTEGTLTFSGSLVPYIALTAQSTATDATVTITISGEATNPKFSFSSVPALPEDEVLARLIFGRSMSNLSPLQIAQLAEAVAQLTGAGGSTSLLQKLRSNLGVDDLDVTTDEKGGAAVSAGKYLNDRTYVTIQKGEKPGSGKARIDLDVGRGVKLRGEASDAGEAKGGIFFEREY
jgi:translocation and assembly module TamB